MKWPGFILTCFLSAEFMIISYLNVSSVNVHSFPEVLISSMICVTLKDKITIMDGLWVPHFHTFSNFWPISDTGALSLGGSILRKTLLTKIYQLQKNDERRELSDLSAQNALVLKK